jgi:uncharacterized damage-inducible protein DinB
MSFAKQLLLTDIDYSAWSNHRLLEACSTYPAEELVHDLRLPHTSILSTLQHVYDAEKVWLDGIRTTDLGHYLLPQDPAPALSLNALKQSWPELWEAYHQWIQVQSEGSLGTDILVQLPGSMPKLARWKILRHLLDHSQFHRGQIVATIRALGHCPPAINRMDYFLREDSD